MGGELQSIGLWGSILGSGPVCGPSWLGGRAYGMIALILTLVVGIVMRANRENLENAKVEIAALESGAKKERLDNARERDDLEHKLKGAVSGTGPGGASFSNEVPDW